MARITVEDCVLRIPNRFDLVLVAAQRARDVSAGAPLTVDRDNDKNPVVALREIAEDTVSTEAVRQAVIQGLQRHVEQDEPEDEDPDVLSLGQGLGAMRPEEASQRRTLVDEEIADDVLTVGRGAIGGEEMDDSEIDQVEDTEEAEKAEEAEEPGAEDAAEPGEQKD